MTAVSFLTLPADLHLCIIQLLPPKAICALRETCKFFRDFVDAHGEFVWRKIAIDNSFLDEQTSPSTGFRVGAWSPGASQGSAADLAVAIDAQKSALGSFDDITTWKDFGLCFHSFDLKESHTEVILAQSGVGSRSIKDGDGTTTAASFR
jgi:hypothetical protein